MKVEKGVQRENLLRAGAAREQPYKGQGGEPKGGKSPG